MASTKSGKVASVRPIKRSSQYAGITTAMRLASSTEARVSSKAAQLKPIRPLTSESAASLPQKPAWFRRRGVVLSLLGLAAVLALRVGCSYLSFPSDRTPQGAYLRIVIAVNRGRPEDFFAYT